jgi:hypothetical protein
MSRRNLVLSEEEIVERGNASVSRKEMDEALWDALETLDKAGVDIGQRAKNIVNKKKANRNKGRAKP